MWLWNLLKSLSYHRWEIIKDTTDATFLGAVWRIYRSLCVGTLCPWWSICETPSCFPSECQFCLRRCTRSVPGPPWCSGTCTGCGCRSLHRTDPRHSWWRRSGQSSPAQSKRRGKWESGSERRENGDADQQVRKTKQFRISNADICSL